jgi:glycosyltransferase involved in cell wall biosynthesis
MLNYKTLPLVSIIITSYNRAQWIGEAIESALAQDYPNLEIIISDNCSTDGSDAIIRSYCRDSRIKYSRNDSNIGMIANFRKATYELSNGEYLVYISSDDKLTYLNFVSDSINLVNKYDNLLLVLGRGRVFYGNFHRDSPVYPFFNQELWDGWEVFYKSTVYGLLTWGGGSLIHKQCLLNVGAFQKNYINADVDSNYKIMLNGNVGFINKICYQAHVHEGSITIQPNLDYKILNLECIRSISEYAKTKRPTESIKIEKWQSFFISTIAYEDLKDLHKKDLNTFFEYKKYLKINFKNEFQSIYSFKNASKIFIHSIMYRFRI